MDFWPVITSIGLPEAWAAIAAGMVFAYLVLRHTSWQKPTPQRMAFKRVTVLLVFTLILAFVAVHSLKTLTRVPRECTPCGGDLEPPGCNPYCIDGDYSFPSGHAATIFSVSTLAFLMLRRRRGSVPAGLLFYLPAGLVAWSRVALGVHTIPDIAAGTLIGLASALVIWKIRPRMGIFA
jgi:membrane-associated phospholipid phosphatase